MKEQVQIEGNEELVRDTKTNAVLNKDVSSLQKYRQQREIRRKERIVRAR